jgi:hypothetical protein
MPIARSAARNEPTSSCVTSPAQRMRYVRIPALSRGARLSRSAAASRRTRCSHRAGASSMRLVSRSPRCSPNFCSAAGGRGTGRLCPRIYLHGSRLRATASVSRRWRREPSASTRLCRGRRTRRRRRSPFLSPRGDRRRGSEARAPPSAPVQVPRLERDENDLAPLGCARVRPRERTRTPPASGWTSPDGLAQAHDVDFSTRRTTVGSRDLRWRRRVDQLRAAQTRGEGK